MFCAMFMAELWTQLGRICCRVKGMSLGRKNSMYGSFKGYLWKTILWVSHCCPVTVHTRPPNLDGHNFHVRAPFWVFLDYMESPLSI